MTEHLQLLEYPEGLSVTSKMAKKETPSQRYGDVGPVVASFTARFNDDDDLTKVTESERCKRQETATEGTDQSVLAFPPLPLC